MCFHLFGLVIFPMAPTCLLKLKVLGIDLPLGAHNLLPLVLDGLDDPEPPIAFLPS